LFGHRYVLAGTISRYKIGPINTNNLFTLNELEVALESRSLVDIDRDRNGMRRMQMQTDIALIA
jgi:hypothetical protein